LLLVQAGVSLKVARSRGAGLGFLSLCVLLLAVAWTGCEDEDETCTSSEACGPGEVCAGAGSGPYHCLKDCTADGACPLGYACLGLTNADCPVCEVVTNACVVRRPDLPRL
jgi:hypothetical protein